MKEGRNNSIDKLFLDELDGHTIEPSAGVWKSLENHIPSSGGRGIIMFLITAIAIAVISSLLLAGLNHTAEQEMASNLYDSTITPAEKPIVETANTSMIANTDEATPTPTPTQHTDPEVKASSAASAPAAIVAEHTTPAKSDNIPIIDQIEKVNNLMAQNAVAEEKEIIIYSHINRLKYRPIVIGLPASEKNNPRIIRELPKPVFDFNIKDSYVKKADILFGAGFSPAVNIYPDGQNRNDFSVDLLASYEKSRFIVEGGIGGNYTSESAKYRINYSSYDSVGYYLGVSSFSINPNNPDSIILETRLKSIYDSINHFSINETTNKFAYLQIPLSIGYRIIQKDRFSIDVKLGVIFSVQVYKEIPEAPYRGSDAKIEVIRQYPDRLKTNWQYTAGAAFNYQINRQLRFSLEPFYRQYLKSVYTPGSLYSARSPYSFGVRAGIYIQF